MGASSKLLFAVIGSFCLMMLSQDIALSQFQCFDCHGTRSTADYRPLDANSRDITTGGFQGNHQRHITSPGSPAACEACHQGSSQYSNAHRDSLIKLRANINNSPVAARYKNTTSVFLQTTTPSLGACTNVNCHFEATTPLWGDAPFSGTGDCLKCHAFPPADGSHAIHDYYYGPGSASCGRCHIDHASEVTPFAHATSAGKRGLILQGFTYSKTVNTNYPNYLPSQTASVNRNGTCSNLSCHQSATWGGSVNHVATLGSDTILVFGGVANAHHSAGLGTEKNCTLCHSADLKTEHANYCALCHSGANPAGALAGNWNRTCQQGACHPSIHTSLNINHNGAYWNSSVSCDQCHDPNAYPWPGPGDNCTSCHDPAQTLATFISRHPPPFPAPATPALTPQPASYEISGSSTASVTFQWSAVTAGDSDPVQYQVEVSSSSSFSTISHYSGWISSPSWTEPLQIGTWYWRVRARDSVHVTAVSIPSTSNSFSIIYAPPPAVSLTAQPTIYLIGSSSTSSVTLQWSAVTAPDGDPIQYQAEVSSASNFSTISYSSSWQSVNNWSQILPVGTWYWRVKALDSVHPSAASTSITSSFGIIDRTPAVPTLIHNAGATTNGANITFGWSQVTATDGDAIQYQAEVSSESSFTTISYISSWQTGTSWTQILPVGSYFWRVRSRDSIHTAAVSSYSSTDSFSITVAASNTFTFSTPGIYYWPAGAETASFVTAVIIGGGGGGEGGGNGSNSSISYGSYTATAYGGNGDGNGGAGGSGSGNLNGQSIINGGNGTLDTENDSENPGGGGSPNGGGAWRNYGGGGGGTVTGSLTGTFSSGSQMTIVVGGGGGSWVGDLEGGSGSVTLSW